jgi:hypothetical protein
MPPRRQLCKLETSPCATVPMIRDRDVTLSQVSGSYTQRLLIKLNLREVQGQTNLCRAAPGLRSATTEKLSSVIVHSWVSTFLAEHKRLRNSHAVSH